MKIDNLSELQLYINFIQVKNNKIYKDYNEIISLLKLEFGVDTTIQQLNELFEPTMDEETRDLEQLWKNIW